MLSSMMIRSRGPHDRTIDEIGDPDRVIDHGECSSIAWRGPLLPIVLDHG